MNTCAQNRMGEDNLDRLSDEQFEIFLDHALSCRECDELLMKYEKGFIPVLKDALAEEISIPIQVVIATNGQLGLSMLKEALTRLTRIGTVQLLNLSKVSSYWKSAWRIFSSARALTAISLFFSVAAFAGMVILGGKSVIDSSEKPLTYEEVDRLSDIVTVDIGPFIKNNEFNREWMTDGFSPPENPVDPYIREGGMDGTNGHVSIVGYDMDVSDTAKTETVTAKSEPDTAPKILTPPESQHEKVKPAEEIQSVRGSLLQFRIKNRPGEKVTCTRSEVFGIMSNNFSQDMNEEECVWLGLPLNKIFFVTVKNVSTGLSETFRVRPSMDPTKYTNVDMTKKPPANKK